MWQLGFSIPVEFLDLLGKIPTKAMRSVKSYGSSAKTRVISGFWKYNLFPLHFRQSEFC